MHKRFDIKVITPPVQLQLRAKGKPKPTNQCINPGQIRHQVNLIGGDRLIGNLAENMRLEGEDQKLRALIPLHLMCHPGRDHDHLFCNNPLNLHPSIQPPFDP